MTTRIAATQAFIAAKPHAQRLRDGGFPCRIIVLGPLAMLRVAERDLVLGFNGQERPGWRISTILADDAAVSAWLGESRAPRGWQSAG